MNEKTAIQTKPLGPLAFSLLAVLIGIVAGLGAVVFRGLIAFFHNLLFLGMFSLSYDANVHTPASPWGALVILVPIVGALGVAFLVKNFAPEAKGHGVPEVMDAIYYNKGVIRPIVAVVKSVASALSIGSGGSIGREGPIIQIGSSFGSTIGVLLRMPVWQRITAIAAGAGGGIAATFNTPIGGVLFALEIMMHEVSVRTLAPVAISTATATYIGRYFFGDHPSFVIPTFETPYFHLTNPIVLFAYVVLGVIMGGATTLFIKSIYGFEDFFAERIGGSYYRQHVIGMTLVGILMYALLVAYGHYYIQGVGYATVQDILAGARFPLYFLLLLYVLKLFVTSLTLGSGASGGIFSPSLFMGATLGGAYGVILHALFPGLAVSPPAFAVAGMAGMVGGATGAAMAAIVMIFEMTLNYNVIIPMTITVAVSYGVRKLLSDESIYTLKLVRRGHYMPEALQTNVQFIRHAKDMMDTNFKVVPGSGTLAQFSRVLAKHVTESNFVVADGDSIVGLLTKAAALEAIGQAPKTTSLKEIASRNYLIVAEDVTLLEVIARMHVSQAPVAVVTSHGRVDSIANVEGLITKETISDSMTEAIEFFSD
jgi:CIC family chloride channel protein